MDLIKDKAFQFSWDPILNIPTSGSGRPSQLLRRILSHELFKANLQGQENLLEKYQSISDEQVIAFPDGYMEQFLNISLIQEIQLSKCCFTIKTETFNS